MSLAHCSYDGTGGYGPHTAQAHKRHGLRIFFGRLSGVLFVLADALVQAGESAQCITDHGIAPARQVF